MPDTTNRTTDADAASPATNQAGEVREGCVGTMDAARAIYFLERFKREEKLLGPHEQWALDFTIAALATQPATSQEGEGVSVAEYNEAHDKIEQVVGGAFRDGFEEGWIYAQTPDGSEYDERKQEFGRAVDTEPSEAWDGYRDKYVAMLPIPALPTLADTNEGSRP